MAKCLALNIHDRQSLRVKSYVCSIYAVQLWRYRNTRGVGKSICDSIDT